ncbi:MULTISPECIES: dipeptide ABC transporter ATP-binding protein [unclassified Streptomyces]|uniref:dipeptide ABC transporter ATP-binding protein n=1 Tax=unclassified Streptomyces TaxID=2593676 RepID=UPI00074731DA|nr:MULTISPECIES: ABC transporter ATP-binding protein [unclassified Streptomyces]KUL69839.1 ABC transporter ATP-binding protein [Streptomyces sp. NRRL WC-3605]KUL75301.1 ABC transporter ATP-binding protein [Streptomyces sp. NRRL WC-3604]
MSDTVKDTAGSLVEVDGLTVDFGGLRAVDGLGFRLERGAALALVGESGSGKSTVASALLGLHRGTGAEVGGTIEVAGLDVGRASEDALRRLRGGTAAMVFQDPLSSLDPYYAVGDQIAEVYRVHTRASRRAARARAVEVLDRVGIPDAVRRSRSRPHEFSGGMRQRALIAMALACEPELLIADEPTTALDVTVQAQILDLLHTLREETGMGLLLVTHDVGVAAESVDEVLVMRHGRQVEHGSVTEVLGAPREPYTRELLGAVPRVDAPRAGRAEPGAETGAGSDAGSGAGCDAGSASGSDGPGEPVLEAVGLHRVFGRGKKAFAAVDGVSITVRRGETLGVVGESGSGKTTLGRMLVGLLEPTAGEVRHDGHARVGVDPSVQMVFQDPVSSLNPRRSVGESIADPLRARGERDETRIRARVRELLERVGLEAAHHDRYPHEFSGGQRQRVGIARALAADPRVIVCDEPVSALDVTTQAQVVALLAELQRELGLALVFIAHDLAVVRQVSDRVAVMRRGRIVEQGPADQVYDHPQDPYTGQLLAAVPALDPAVAARRRSARREPATI